MHKNTPRHILITRTEEPLIGLSDGQPLLSYLEKNGIQTTIAPLLTIQPVPKTENQVDPKDSGVVQAILFTSSHAVKLWAERDQSRDILVLTVGDHTASVAQELGFTHIRSAGGDVTELLALVKSTLNSGNGKILYPCARFTSVNIAEKLQPLGFVVEPVIVYDAVPVKELSTDVRQKIHNQLITDIIFFSARGAATFKNLIDQDHSLKTACKKIHCLCFSHAIAQNMQEFPWKSLHITAKPDIPSLIELIETTDSSQRDNPMFYPEKDTLTRISSFTSLILVLLLGAGLFTYPQWFASRSSENALPSNGLEQWQSAAQQLTSSLQAQESRLNKLETLLQNTNDPSVTVRLQNLEQQLAIIFEKLSVTNPALDLNPLLSSLQDLSKRLTYLETTNQNDGQNIQSLTQESTQLRNQLNNSNSRLQSLENAWNIMTADRQQGQTQMMEIANQVKALQEKAKIDQDPTLAALFLTAGQFETALMNGQGFVNELAAIKRLGAHQPPVMDWLKKAEVLEPWAVTGLLSYPQLQQKLNEVSQQAAQDDLAQGLRQNGWDRQLAAQLSGLITIRPIGAQTVGDDLLSKLARAEAKFTSRQFAAAAAELTGDQLPTYIQEWRNHLNARIQADLLLVEFKNIILKNFVSNP
ncbi:MAG: uroporphyrinogen-III synthase [Rhodospirillaceae bacterium]|nr:uroporphyrinogen-III synthase [Rhodospirillaceae bacterium]